MLLVNNLYKQYGRFVALNNLNLEIPKGEIFGFVGPNGAGKTTTMKIIAGLLKADSGNVFISGINVLKNSSILKRKIGYMPDFFGVYNNLKAIEYMEFYAAMYAIEGKQARKACLDAMDLVNLVDKKDSYVDTLSRGMKQRLCLARCLVHNPELLILDEPASGLDPRARVEMKEILKNLQQIDKTIIISSHILPELGEICSSIGIIEYGRIIIKGKVEDILTRVKGNNRLIIDVLDKQDIALQILKKHPLVEKLSIKGDSLIVAFLGEDRQEAQLLKELIEQGVLIKRFMREQGNLETLFMQLTN